MRFCSAAGACGHAACSLLEPASQALLLTVLFGASQSFLTPMGYQTNLMVFGPGRYRFFDVARYGAGLTVLMTLLVPGLILVQAEASDTHAASPGHSSHPGVVPKADSAPVHRGDGPARDQPRHLVAGQSPLFQPERGPVGSTLHRHVGRHGDGSDRDDVGRDLTTCGQAVLALMILVGGLGLMAITTFLQGFVVRGVRYGDVWTAVRRSTNLVLAAWAALSGALRSLQPC